MIPIAHLQILCVLNLYIPMALLVVAKSRGTLVWLSLEPSQGSR